MAITASDLFTAVGDTTNNLARTSPAFTPGAGELMFLLLGIADADTSSVSSFNDSLSSGGWSKLREDEYTDISVYNLTAYYKHYASAAASQTLNVNFDSSVDGSCWAGLRITGHNTTTPVKSNHARTTGATDPAPSLASADADSLVVAVVQARRNTPVWTAEAGWTEFTGTGGVGHGTPAHGMQAWYKIGDSAFTSTGTDLSHQAQIYEIDMAAVAGAAKLIARNVVGT